MPAAIIAGLPPDIEKRVLTACRNGQVILDDVWVIAWIRSKSRIPGLAPSQLPEVRKKASTLNGAHVLIFRGRNAEEEALIVQQVAPYFRVRWLNNNLLSLIPHSIDRFGAALVDVLNEELEWNSVVKPQNEACCLLLPECAFLAHNSVKHLWTSAGQAGGERIKSTARAVEKFKSSHWLSHKDGERAWIDGDAKVFGHRGNRHGEAPFPRSWKFSCQIPSGFHFDVTSKHSRAFRVVAWNQKRHDVGGSEHINIDPHGWVRA